MVEKMKLVHFTGPKYDIDRVMKVYLDKYDIHFENAISSLSTLEKIHPFAETNAYYGILQKADELINYLDVKDRTVPVDDITKEEAKTIIEENWQDVNAILNEQKILEAENTKLEKLMERIEDFRNLDFEYQKILDLRFIHFQFGKIPIDYYYKMQNYISKTAYTLFYECHSDSDYVWGVYFVPRVHAEDVDAVFLSFHFEQIFLPDTIEGTVEEEYVNMGKRLKDNTERIQQLDEKIKEDITNNETKITSAHYVIKRYSENFDVRKFAACTRAKSDDGEHYILYGWMSKKQAKRLLKETEHDDKIQCIVEDGNENLKPPTRLKNPKMLKPFELFVEMYGLPAYNEMDPTLFVAFTYTFMFGIMFGDVGQGLLLVIGGFLLYRFKGVRLAGVISIAGIWSTVFGFLYGSIFGFEEILPAIWMRPMDNIMNTLMMAILFGAALIVFAMILNIINAIRAKEYGRLLFSQSGISGLLFYGFVIVCVLLVLNGHSLPATILIAVAVGIPLIAIMLKEPLSHLVEKKGSAKPNGSIGMFLVEALVECFDVVLSYATNTISFVRVGAFALSHAGMMGVVMTLAGLERGNPNIFIIIIGNIVVMGLEGLVVGIQVLRLEYYEMFSRFYKGDGRPFHSFHQKNNKK